MASEPTQNYIAEIKPAPKQEIFLNGEKQTVAQNFRLDLLLQENGLSQTLGVAVAVNYQVIPKTKWAESILKDGDKITVIKATQGG